MTQKFIYTCIIQITFHDTFHCDTRTIMFIYQIKSLVQFREFLCCQAVIFKKSEFIKVITTVFADKYIIYFFDRNKVKTFYVFTVHFIRSYQ